MNTKKNKDGQIGVRMPKDIIEIYNELCYKNNTIPSIRIRKFIEIEIDFFKKNKDVLKDFENNGK